MSWWQSPVMMSHQQWKLDEWPSKNILFIYTSCGQCEFFVQIMSFTYVPSEQHVAVPCFLSFCGQREKKKKLWAITLRCFIYSDNRHIYKLCIMTWLKQEENVWEVFLSLSSIDLHFHSIDIMGKKSDNFLPLNSIMLFSALTSAPAESVIFISSQRCHTLKYIFNNQMCITVTFNSKSKYVSCSRVNNLQCV